METNTQPAEARSPKTTVETGEAATEKATPERINADVIAAAQSLTKDKEARQAQANQLAISFIALDKQLHGKSMGGSIVRTIDKMLPVIEQVRGLISRKGDPAFKELRRLAKLPEGGKYATIPEFNTYLTDIAEEFGLSLRTLQRKLAELRGEPMESESHEAGGSGSNGKVSYTPPNRREFTPFVLVAEHVNSLLDEYDHGGDIAPVMDSLRKLAIPADRVGKALESTRTLETAEKAVAPVIASAAAYIRALEDALYQSTPERLARVERYKAEWRVLRHDAKLKPLYEAVGAFTNSPEAHPDVDVEEPIPASPEPMRATAAS